MTKPLYRQSVGEYSLVEHQLSERLAEQMRREWNQTASAAERRAWDNSVPELVAVLREAGLEKTHLLLEYPMPLSSKRADAVIAGVSKRTGRPAYVVVELKQWSHADLFEDNRVLVSIADYRGRGVTHPVEQVRGYVSYLTDYTVTLAQDPAAVQGLAYLYNASDTSIAPLLELPGDDTGRLFTGSGRTKLVNHLHSVFTEESGADAADQLIGSRIAPSKQLLALAADEVQRREMFVLLDEQRDAYEHVLHAINQARQHNTKTAVIVSGGPGSGKSVIALSLMGSLARQGREVLHATGSRSFTQTLRKVAGARNRRVQDTFKYFNSFMSAEPNSLECLILDEAHRIRQTSANRWTAATARTGRAQIDELLAAARVPVFLLDEFQVVRPGELGSVDLIRHAASAQGINSVVIRLDAQFRSGGSEAYVTWVKSLLQLEGRHPIGWQPDGRIDVRTFDDPASLEDWLDAKRSEGFGARIAAGYDWRWSDPKPDGTVPADVRIGDWARPWNLKGERSISGFPPASLWATDPAGFGQVGCVYTAQGFEYDYAGVILGPDMVWRDDTWVFDRTANKDPDFRSVTRVSQGEFESLVRNVYKVLLTRGLQGVGVYSTDGQTRDHLTQLIG